MHMANIQIPYHSMQILFPLLKMVLHKQETMKISTVIVHLIMQEITCQKYQAVLQFVNYLLIQLLTLVRFNKKALLIILVSFSHVSPFQRVLRTPEKLS